MAGSPPAARSPLLATKFFVPAARPGAIPRTRLIEQLDRGLNAKLVLISAPPGFGKTTLLAEWLTSRTAPVAWLSLDAADNRPPTFWTYLVTALNTANPAVGGVALAMLQSPQLPPIETVLSTLLNDLAAIEGELLLVLDDYHVIETADIHTGIEFLLEHLPPHVRLVIASRADPMLPLSRMRVRGQLTEIRAADLRFTAEETAAFLNGVMGLDLTAGRIKELDARTEGWIAALQLAALSMRGRDDIDGFLGAFAGDDRFVVDYLVDEVLQRQPGHIREFLLHTSILERLSSPLCDAVMGGTGSRSMLETLERSNLFVVPLDNRRQWFRYHHLFADVLRAHLQEEEPATVATLHMRASDWYAEQGETEHAVRHAIAAGNFERAARLVEREAQDIVRSHRPDVLIEWLRPIPGEVVRALPVLSAYYGHALQGMGDMEGSHARLDEAELAYVATAATMSQADRDMVESRIAVGRGYLAVAAGDLDATVEFARRARELILPDEHHWHGTAAGLLAVAHWKRGELEAAQPLQSAAVTSFEHGGDSGLATTSAYHEADLLKARGRLNEARRRYERSLEFCSHHGGSALRMAPNLYLGLSELCCERNDLAGAALHLQQAEALGIYPPRTPFRHTLARARLHQAHGEYDAALELLDEAARLQVRGAVPDTRPIPAWRARLHLMQGRIADAAAWAEREALTPDDPPDFAREYAHLTLARLLLAQGRAERDHEAVRDALRLLACLEEAARQGGRMAAVIESRLLRALGESSLGDTSRALDTLTGALELAQPEGFARLFIEEGAPMRDLLRKAVAAGVGGNYAHDLLAATGQRPAATPAPHPAMAALAEPLTTREIEILRLVAAGMQNQDVADHLVISLATVKRHVANVYGKLDVNNRTAAVARARELQLL